jgi:hypothetical protein
MIVKKIAVFAIISHSMMINAKISIPSIERVHKKVEAAKESALSLRDLIKNGDTKHLIVNPEHGVIATNGIINKSITETAEQKLDDAEKTLNALYWSNQTDVITRLNTTTESSEYEAAKELKVLIKEKYPQTRSILVSFAQELEHEEDVIKGFATTLLKLSEAKNSALANKDVFLKRLKELYNKHNMLSENLQKLTTLTNKLLM